MKFKEFRETNEFKMADCIDYLYEDGTEFDGTYRQLEKSEIIELHPYKEGGLIKVKATIRR